MNVIKIDKKSWAEGLQKLENGFTLFGPVENGNNFDFKELPKGEAPLMDVSNTNLSFKSVIYPQSEDMFEYSLDENVEGHHVMKEVDTDYSPRAIIGLRPCDAASLRIVQRNFDNPEYKDPFWIKSYEACTFVGYACNEPQKTCFCTSVGGGPYNEEGLDILLVDDKEGYLAKVLTEKGEALLKAGGWSEKGDGAGIEAMKQAAEEKITSTVNTDNLKDIKAIDHYEASFWEDVAFACISCGTCTYSCPTCWCFDIQDEVKDNSGIRMRNWDSCMSPLFTLEGSGHNPRPDKYQRVRQRFMHKLKYYVDKYEAGVQCVGCGRCVRLCPVNIDIRKVCEKMNDCQTA